MVYTEGAPRWQQLYKAPAMQQTALKVDHMDGYIFKNLLLMATVTHSESHATRVQPVCSTAENSIILR